MNGDIIKLAVVFLILLLIHAYYSGYASFIEESGGFGKVKTAICSAVTLMLIYIANSIIFFFIFDNVETDAKAFMLFLGIPIMGVIYIATAIIVTVKNIIMILDKTKYKSRLINCKVYKSTYTGKLIGVSMEGKKNTFRLIGKDAIDVYMMYYNGVYNFEIEYYKKSKKIISIKPLINTNSIM